MKARQTPTFERRGPFTSTDCKQAAALVTAFFGEPLEWQRYVLDVFCARNEHDKYAYPVIGLSVPRQNGKSWIARARCFYGALNGEKILYICLSGDTRDKTLQQLSAPFEDEDEPELQALLKAVRKTNGRQSIRLNNGGLIRFTTRINSLERGEAYDVLIYDEAQELTSSQQAVSLPAIFAGPKHNPQTIYLGIPPSPSNIGDVFKKLHASVHDNTSSMTWIEWAADSIRDIEDVSRWYKFNPSLGTLINVSDVEADRAQMFPDVFARERLGWWPSAQGSGGESI